MKLQESGENYLETILLLRQQKGYVRSIDIANALQFSKPSVSRAVGILKKAGYIQVESSGNIVLTGEGEKRAGKVYERHRVITRFLADALGVDEKTAEEDACRIEHVISEESFSRIRAYVGEREEKVK
ncbi:MAG: metal-dependent transcriptional regulator [Clostridiales bacterium]|nr:metal-dependent transcriptional regulator [Clostridiales bacterium]